VSHSSDRSSIGVYSWDKLQKRQAEVFAAYLLMPKLRLTTRHFQTARSNLVEDYGIMEKFAGFRLKLLEAVLQQDNVSTPKPIILSFVSIS